MNNVSNSFSARQFTSSGTTSTVSTTAASFDIETSLRTSISLSSQVQS
jgi:hypothetical protein